MEIAAVGGFHVGGCPVEPGGPVEGQLYVQCVRLARPSARFPLVLLPGGGLTGACFGDTPDGRPGWQQVFLEAGHEVFVVDPVGAGRAGWRPRERAPIVRGGRELWELFRIGPQGSYAVEAGERRPYGDGRFPAESFDAFLRQVVPVNRDDPALRQAAYTALLERVGPAVLLSHSAAGPYAERAALAAPSLVRAHVVVEPSGAPDPEAVDLERLRDVPHLFLWGDHLDMPMWREECDSARHFHEALLRAGCRSDWIDLPAHGEPGNSHLPMLDANSARVAGLIAEWLEAATAG